MTRFQIMPIIDINPERSKPTKWPPQFEGLCEFAAICTLEKAAQYSRLFKIATAGGELPEHARCFVSRRKRGRHIFIARLPLAHLTRFLRLLA